MRAKSRSRYSTTSTVQLRLVAIVPTDIIYRKSKAILVPTTYSQILTTYGSVCFKAQNLAYVKVKLLFSAQSSIAKIPH